MQAMWVAAVAGPVPRVISLEVTVLWGKLLKLEWGSCRAEGDAKTDILAT